MVAGSDEERILTGFILGAQDRRNFPVEVPLPGTASLR